MATTKKIETIAKKTEKTEAEVKKASTPKASAESKLQDDNKLLREQLAALQAQVALMMQATTAQPVVEPKNENRPIKFVSLKDATIILRGSSIWEIKGRYNYRIFPEKEARTIVLNMHDYLTKGSVYIDDAQFVRENGLDVFYSTFISDTDLKNLLNKNATDVIQTYQNVNDNQKEIILDMLVDKKRSGEYVDNNVLAELETLSGRNLIKDIDD